MTTISQREGKIVAPENDPPSQTEGGEHPEPGWSNSQAVRTEVVPLREGEAKHEGAPSNRKLGE